MAIWDDLGGIFSGAGNYIPSTDNFVEYGIAIAVTILLIWGIRKIPKAIERGRERKLARKAGGTFRSDRRKVERLRRNVIKLKAALKATKIPKDAKAVKSAEKIEESETDVEKETTRLAEAANALVAGLWQTTKEMIHEVRRKLVMAEVGEKEVANLAALERRIKHLNLKEVEPATADYLHRYLQSLAQHVGKQISYEEQNEESQKTFIALLKQSIQEMLPVSKFAKREEKALERKEKRDKKTLKREIRKIGKEIKGKAKQLARELSKGNNADPRIVAQVRQQLKVLRNNQVALEAAKGQLERLHALIDAEIAQLKKILAEIVKVERAQKRHSKGLKRRDSKLSKRLSKLEERQKGIEESIGKFHGAEEISGLILAFSHHLNQYFGFYIDTLKEDLSFEQLLREFILNNILVERSTEKLMELLIQLDNSEKAVAEGTARIIGLARIYNQDVSTQINQELAVLRAESKVLDNEKRVETEIKALNQKIKARTLGLVHEIDQLIAKEKKIIAENQALHQQEADHLSNAMGTMQRNKQGRVLRPATI